jgi:hypothetical protein
MPDSWDVRRSGQRMPLGLPPLPAAAAKRKSSRMPIVIGIVGVVAVSAAAATVAWYLTSPRPRTPPPVETAAASAPEPAPVPAPAPAPVPTASAPAPKLAPKDARACFAQLMPTDAFGDTTPDLKPACSGRRAYPTTLVLKSAVVAAGKNSVTDAMREWSMLGWYETAAFAAMRAHCCPDAKALTVTSTFAECRLEEALAYVANAIDDPDKMKDATKKYQAAVMCLTGRGWANAFGRGGPPYGGEMVHFDKVMKRIAGARGR